MKKSILALAFCALMLLASSAQAIDRIAAWIDNSNNETNFVVQRCSGICTVSGAWTEIVRLGANVTGYTITGAQPNTTTSYRVGALNAAGTAYSAILVDVIPLAPLPPTAPVFTLPPCKTLTETAPGIYRCN